MQTSLRTAITVRRLADLGGLDQWHRLQQLVEQVFGPGDRPHGWFRRKLHREVTNTDLSWIAVTHDDLWCGYALVGMPASWPLVARTVGVGVLDSYQGRGVGRDLVAAAIAAAAARGATCIRTVATASARPFYRRLGFGPGRPVTTMIHHGQATMATDLSPPLPWHPARYFDRGHREACAWLREAWDATEVELRRSAVVDTPEGPAVVHLSREGVAWLVHRVVCPPHPGTRLALVVEGVRRRIDARTSLLVPALERAAAVSLQAHGWTPAQVGYEMEAATERTVTAPPPPTIPDRPSC